MGLSATATAEESTPTLEAVRVHGTVVVDGLPNDPVWQEAPSFSAFTEREPSLGGTPELRTQVQAAYDDEALYFLVRAQVRPGHIALRTLRRDSFAIFDDDSINIKIDPNHDRRTSYNLTVNTAGAQQDMLVLDDGRAFIPEWDGVWEAEVTQTEREYIVEYRVPFVILGAEGETDTMGFNLNRVTVEPIAKYDFRLPVPPERFNSASTYGTITGLVGLRPKQALELTPFVVTRFTTDQDLTLKPGRQPVATTGLDARWQTGPGSYIEASVLTDFAEVNIDEVNIAGDRFPLFFPEQRPFFINGLSVFNFGRQGSAQLFNSRTVGLKNGRTVPILAAGKAYGRVGDLSYAVLDVQTLRAPALSDDDVAAPPEHFAVGRLRYSPSRTAWVGAMALGRRTFDAARADHLSLGVDSELRSTDGSLNWYSFGAFTHTETAASALTPATHATAQPGRLATRRGTSAATSLNYRTLATNSELAWTWSDNEFAPELGFYERTAVSKQTGTAQWTPRPGTFGVRQVSVGPAWETTANASHDALLKRSLGAEAIIDFNNTAQLTYRYADELDNVRTPFTLFDYAIPAGRYHGPFHRVALRSPARQWARGQIVYRYQRVFGGERHTMIQSLTLRPSAHFSFDGTYTYLRGHFQEDQPYAVSFANSSLEIAIHRDLVFDSLGRLSLAPGRERLGFQNRLRYRYAPGSDVFLVARGDEPLRDARAAGERSRYEVLLKVAYYFRETWDRD